MLAPFDWQNASMLAMAQARRNMKETTMTQIKDFLTYENERNKRYAPLYTAILQHVWGADTDVLVGHHICTEQAKDIKTENEIPSADTLIFDHDIMKAVFGDHHQHVMIELARTPCSRRDDHLRHYWNLYHTDKKVVAPSGE